MNRFIARELRAIKASAQTVNLVINLAPAFLERVGQRGIYPPQLLLQPIQLAIESFRGVLKRRGGFFAEIAFDHARYDVIESAEKIHQVNPIALERAPGMLLYKSQAGARQNRRHRTIQQAINFGGLREVSNLCRASIVGNRREQSILDYGTQQGVGGKIEW